jgi:uncharacterized protein YegP (UPF0339 family)
MYFHVFEDIAGQWRWWLRAANHETIAVSSESYVAKRDCLYSIGLAKSACNAPVYDV